LAAQPEIVEITRALLALSTAVRETQRAAFLLKTAENDEVQRTLEKANEANIECLEHIEKLISLIGPAGD
jgi:hypothetical protein